MRREWAVCGAASPKARFQMPSQTSNFRLRQGELLLRCARPCQTGRQAGCDPLRGGMDPSAYCFLDKSRSNSNMARADMHKQVDCIRRSVSPARCELARRRLEAQQLQPEAPPGESAAGLDFQLPKLQEAQRRQCAKNTQRRSERHLLSPTPADRFYGGRAGKGLRLTQMEVQCRGFRRGRRNHRTKAQ